MNLIGDGSHFDAYYGTKKQIKNQENRKALVVLEEWSTSSCHKKFIDHLKDHKVNGSEFSLYATHIVRDQKTDFKVMENKYENPGMRVSSIITAMYKLSFMNVLNQQSFGDEQSVHSVFIGALQYFHNMTLSEYLADIGNEQYAMDQKLRANHIQCVTGLKTRAVPKEKTFFKMDLFDYNVKYWKCQACDHKQSRTNPSDICRIFSKVKTDMCKDRTILSKLIKESRKKKVEWDGLDKETRQKAASNLWDKMLPKEYSNTPGAKRYRKKVKTKILKFRKSVMINKFKGSVFESANRIPFNKSRFLEYVESRRNYKEWTPDFEEEIYSNREYGAFRHFKTNWHQFNLLKGKYFKLPP